MSRLSIRALPLMAALLLVVSAEAALGQEDQGQEDQATVTVFHAVPAEDGFPADVYLDGNLIIDGFVFETASEPMDTPAGTAELLIFPNGADPETDEPAASEQITVEAGLNYSIVAQVLDDAPVLSVFVNDTSQVAAGEARLTVRQTSGLDSIDVAVDGEDLFEAVAVASDVTADLSAGAHTVAFRSGDSIVAEQPVDLGEGQVTVLYTVGSPADGTFGVLVQQISALQTSPGGVPSGTGGEKASSSPPVTLAITAVMAVVLAVMLLARRVAHTNTT